MHSTRYKTVSMYIILHLSRNSGNIYSWWNSYKQTFEYIHTYVNRLVELHFEFIQFDDDQIFRKDSTAMEIRFCDHCLRVISSHFINHFTSTWLRNIFHSFTEYRVVYYNNLYKFFSLRLLWNLYWVQLREL